jgi:hypothetical protein
VACREWMCQARSVRRLPCWSDCRRGGECWFWLTASAANSAFLYLAPTAEDPEGVAFQAELPRLFRRFAHSFEDAITGVMSQPTAGRLLFSSNGTRAQHFAQKVEALSDRYGAEFPALRALSGAALPRAEVGAQPRVIATAATA